MVTLSDRDRPMKLFSSRKVIVLSLLYILLLGYIDYRAGSELSLSLFYAFPVIASIWFSGVMTGIIFTAVSVIVMILADYFSIENREIFSSIYVWNLLAIVGYYSLIVVLLHIVKVSLTREHMMAVTDSLTGIHNVRSFRERAESERLRSLRYGHMIGIMFIDCDNFKRINDTFGHHAGDDFLRTIGLELKRRIRQNDSAGRIGGDEFAVLMPEIGSDFSIRHVEEINNHLRNAVSEFGKEATFSIGMVVLKKIPGSVDDMLRVADDSMYEAKRTGKDRVMMRTFE
jgi:diguanylate cyclase (GGDEF)-like protein